MQQLLTVREYAELKRISENTVRRLIARHEIEVERFGRAIRINPHKSLDGFEKVNLPDYLHEAIARMETKKRKD